MVKFGKKIILFLMPILLLIGIEFLFYTWAGAPSFEMLEEKWPEFKYYYKEILSPAFKAEKLKNGVKKYVMQREFPMIVRSSFIMPKPPHTKRIFIVGGSIAHMFQENLLQEHLSEVYPGEEIEVINCGAAAYDSYRVLLMVKEIVNYKPDLIIVMSGNNEHYSSLSYSYHNLYLDKVNEFLLQKSWLYTYFSRYIKQWVQSDEELATTSIPLKIREKNYFKNINLIIKTARNKDVAIGISTIPIKLKGFLPRNVLDFDDQDIFMGLAYYEINDLNQALTSFREYLTNDPHEALVNYYVGIISYKLSQFENAKEYFEKAANLNKDWYSATPLRNEKLRNIATREETFLFDLDRAMQELSPHGITGGDLFIDDCHWYAAVDRLLVYEFILKLTQSELKKFITAKATIEKMYYDKKELMRIHKEENGIIKMNLDEFFSKFMYALSFVLVGDFDGSIILEENIVLLQELFEKNPVDFNNIHTEDFKRMLKYRMQEDIEEQYTDADIEQQWPSVLAFIAKMFFRMGDFSAALECSNQAITLQEDLYCAYVVRMFANFKLQYLDRIPVDYKYVSKNAPYLLDFDIFKKFYKQKNI
ncbi:hypothetical protein ACFL3D_05995 [Candidatus Omnitrophota bacterium]